MEKIEQHYKGKTLKKVKEFLKKRQSSGVSTKELQAVAKQLGLENEDKIPRWDLQTDIDVKLIEDCEMDEHDWTRLVHPYLITNLNLK